MVSTRSATVATPQQPTQQDSSSDDENDKTGFSKITRKRKQNKRTKHNNNKKGKPHPTKVVNEDGEVKDMQGNVFQCYKESQDKHQFRRTLNALERYIERNLDHAQDLAVLTKDMITPNIAEPTNKKKLLKTDDFARGV